MPFSPVPQSRLTHMLLPDYFSYLQRCGQGKGLHGMSQSSDHLMANALLCFIWAMDRSRNKSMIMTEKTPEYVIVTRAAFNLVIPAVLLLTWTVMSHKMLPSTLYIMSPTCMHLQFFKFEVAPLATSNLKKCRCIHVGDMHCISNGFGDAFTRKLISCKCILHIATSNFAGAWWVLSNILCDLDPNSVWNFRTVTLYSYAIMEVNRMYPDQTIGSAVAQW